MSKKWYHHFSVIMSMKDLITKNQEEVYQKIYSILNDMPEITHETYRHEVLHDLTLCIMYMCKVEFTAQLFQYIEEESFFKEYHQTRTQQNNQMLNWINKLTDTIQEYDKAILDNPKISRVENELLKYLGHYKRKLQENQHKKHEKALANLTYNYIHSQKILTDTGVMYLLARLLCVTFQVVLYDEYQKSRMKFTEIIYEIIKYFFTQKNIVKGNFIYDIEPIEIYKKTKDIDIHNEDQIYTTTFHQLLRCDNPEYFNDPVGIEWKNYLFSTFKSFDKFIGTQALRRYDKYENKENTRDDFEK